MALQRTIEIPADIEKQLHHLAGGNQELEVISRAIYRAAPECFKNNEMIPDEIVTRVGKWAGVEIKVSDLMANGNGYWESESGKVAGQKIDSLYKELIERKKRKMALTK